VPTLNCLSDRYQDVAQWCGVYISEAHAEDEWPISSARYNGDRGPVTIQQARSLEDRTAAAEEFLVNFPLKFPLWCADMEGQFESLYHPWPIRFFVLCGETKKILHVSGVKNCAPDLAALCDVLDSLSTTSSSSYNCN